MIIPATDALSPLPTPDPPPAAEPDRVLPDLRGVDDDNRRDHADDDHGTAGADAGPGDTRVPLSDRDRERLRTRLAAAVQLARRAGTDGEKTAALAAIERISLRLGQPAPNLNDPDLDDYGFKRDRYRDGWTSPDWDSMFKTRRGRSFDDWIKIVENDHVFFDIFTSWAAHARAKGWHENAVQAAQDYAAEYGVTPDDIDLGM